MIKICVKEKKDQKKLKFDERHFCGSNYQHVPLKPDSGKANISDLKLWGIPRVWIPALYPVMIALHFSLLQIESSTRQNGTGSLEH
jgi:hypothetical protein